MQSGSGRRNERLAFLFAIGLFAFNPPLLLMFDGTSSLFGIPVLYFYLFFSWACLIGLAAFSIEGPAAAEDAHDVDDVDRPAPRSDP